MKYLVPLMAVFALSACYEDTDVTFHEPGVYKGKPDSHVKSYEARADILARRFQQVQTDR